MDTTTITLGTAPTDIGASLSAGIFTDTTRPAGSVQGRGSIRLYNAAVDASIYVAVQDTTPDGDTAAVRVRPQTWFPIELQVTPDGGVWAWASRADTKASAWVTSWR